MAQERNDQSIPLSQLSFKGEEWRIVFGVGRVKRKESRPIKLRRKKESKQPVLPGVPPEGIEVNMFGQKVIFR